MKTPIQKLEKMVSKNPLRSSMNHCHLDTKKGNLVATNGKALVIVPVEIEDGDTSGAISKEGLKAARRDRKGDRSLSVNGNETVSTGPDAGKTFPRPEAGNFPNYIGVLPTKGKAQFSISLSAELLETVCAAIKGGDRSVCGEENFTRLTFHFKEANSAGLVEAGNGATAAIMPLSSTL